MMTAALALAPMQQKRKGVASKPTIIGCYSNVHSLIIIGEIKQKYIKCEAKIFQMSMNNSLVDPLEAKQKSVCLGATLILHSNVIII